MIDPSTRNLSRLQTPAVKPSAGPGPVSPTGRGRVIEDKLDLSASARLARDIRGATAEEMPEKLSRSLEQNAKALDGFHRKIKGSASSGDAGLDIDGAVRQAVRQTLSGEHPGKNGEAQPFWRRVTALLFPKS